MAESARPPPSPRVEGLEPTFRHLDDPEVPWQAVKAQRNADGSVAQVWEKWLAFSPDPQYLTIYARYDPGMVVRRHGHFSPHVVFVLEGEVSFGDRRCPAGTHIELPRGAAFGPVVAGPEGAVMFEVMMGDPRSWGDEPEAYEAALAAQGAEALPDPPLEFPAGSKTCARTGPVRRRVRMTGPRSPGPADADGGGGGECSRCLRRRVQVEGRHRSGHGRATVPYYRPSRTNCPPEARRRGCRRVKRNRFAGEPFDDGDEVIAARPRQRSASRPCWARSCT